MPGKSYSRKRTTRLFVALVAMPAGSWFGPCKASAKPPTSQSVTTTRAAIEEKVEGKIAFESRRGGGLHRYVIDIYVMNADGTGQRNLTNHPSFDQYPSWSPDGKRIAFMSRRDGEQEIYVMNADGSEQKRVTHSPAADTYPAWSPDGTMIAFASCSLCRRARTSRKHNVDVYVMNADGSEQKVLAQSPGTDNCPSWSPDGTMMAFSSCSSCRRGDTSAKHNVDVFVMNTDGSGVKRLTNSPGTDAYPSWSPDGTKIAFSSERDGNTEVYVMNTDGTQQRNLTNSARFDENPSWSPDGEVIAYDSALREGGNADIWIMNADGTGKRRLTSNPGHDANPSWQPSPPTATNPATSRQR